ncbi:MAG TPA: Mth938-like domain-containing protein [Geminicoccaceae bacterium]|nr:Mth938-like domain-containing protein [Geminicoccaceae bacterium]
MAIEPAVAAGRQLIQAYHAGGFRIAGLGHEGSVLVLPERTLPWPVSAPDQVTPESLAPIVAAAPAVELLILGLGPRFLPVAAELRQALKGHGIALEAMDTGAACRTYNVLLAEERRAAAALIAL